jgi:pSer/pThr/pTyr-binding forkhead associated (FHA) protein
LPERKDTAPPIASTALIGGDGGLSGTLSCIRGPEAGLTLSLAPGTYTIGRARENDLVLRDIAASRKHLQIDVDGSVARLVDLGSGNGTKLNGKRAGESELRHGDVIEIGASALVYAAPGRVAMPTLAVTGDDPQARVVAAADELARELSQKLRFGDGEGADGHVAKTRALPSADARAADAAARENAAKRPPDRLWNETFTNLPLSAVIADDQRLQGTGVKRERETARLDSAAPVRPPVPRRPVGPIGTVAADDDDDAGGVDDEGGEPVASAVIEQASPTRSSYLVSVLASAGVVVLLSGVGYAAWSLLLNTPSTTTTTTTDTATTEYLGAINRAQDAIARQDWAGVREYTVVALQVKPDDPLALTYQREADKKLAAATPTNEAKVPTPDDAGNNTAAAAPESAAAEPAPREQKAAPPPPPAPPSAPSTSSTRATSQTGPVSAVAPKVRPRSEPPSRAPKRKVLSDDEAKSRFERAIDALRARDTEAGCKLLQQIVQRAAEDGAWRAKAENLARKRCSE